MRRDARDSETMVDGMPANGRTRRRHIEQKESAMAEEKPIVESFQLDHTKVKAPYVRYIDTETGPLTAT